jgi:murein DD-endopeptidase MepM/ murein hydrolase activator NlpD
LADGFDFPVGKPDAAGYYRFRGFIRGDHMGEDWNGSRGGNSDLGAPVYAIGHGIVVYSKDYASNWGNVVIIRHAYRENGTVRYVDSLYGHLHQRLVQTYDTVSRGDKIGSIGSNRGMYVAHLHFEIRKNINIALKHRDYAMDFSNYHRPSEFISQRRVLAPEFTRHPVPVDCFGFGVQNLHVGTRLESLPELPFGGAAPRPAMNPVIRDILVRNGLYARTEPTPEDKAEAAERDKILEHWRRMKRAALEAEQNNDPVEPKE